MPLDRIAITGSSGAYGRGLINVLRRHHPDAEILGIDIRAPDCDQPDEFYQCDITKDDALAKLVAFKPDTMIHLAFIVNPIRDEDKMGRINLQGALNFLEAARRCAPERVLVSSSATVYGAWPDNPVPLPEEAPLRPRHKFRYCADKAAVEHALEDFAAEQREIAVSWTRPSIIYTPGTSNYLISFIANAKVIALPSGARNPLQFVHVEDVSGATLALLENNARGAFNVSPGDWVSLHDIAKLTARPCISVPFFICRAGAALWWALDLPWFRSPSSIWYFIRYPWVVTSAKLTGKFGFQFRYSTRETVHLMLSDLGILPRSKPGSKSEGGALPVAGDAIASSSQSTSRH